MTTWTPICGGPSCNYVEYEVNKLVLMELIKKWAPAKTAFAEEATTPLPQNPTQAYHQGYDSGLRDGEKKGLEMAARQLKHLIDLLGE